MVGSSLAVFAPADANGVGVYDAVSEAFTLVDISSTVSHGNKYAGAVAYGSRVYFAPHQAEGVGIFDAIALSFDFVNISSVITGDAKFMGAVMLGILVSLLQRQDDEFFDDCYQALAQIFTKNFVVINADRSPDALCGHLPNFMVTNDCGLNNGC